MVVNVGQQPKDQRDRKSQQHLKWKMWGLIHKCLLGKCFDLGLHTFPQTLIKKGKCLVKC